MDNDEDRYTAGRIAILGQENRLREAVRRIVRRLGYEPVVLCSSAASASGSDNPEAFKMLVLTGESDSLSSMALIRESKSMFDPQTPMLCLLPKEQFDDVSALRREGADEVIAKPSSFAELFSVLRLFASSFPGKMPSLERRWGGYRFLMQSNAVEFGGRRVQLRPDEFDLAIELFAHEGCTVARDALWDAVWAKPWDGKSRMLDTCVSVLRRALKLPSNGWELRAVWGAGYRLDGSSGREGAALPYWTPSSMRA
jgi:DNA-binding response OmpR family regulator